MASRLRTAVTTAATPKTVASSRTGRPALTRAATPPAYRKTPSASARWASTSTAARNATVGRSERISASASDHGTSPPSTATAAAGTAARASGSPRGRIDREGEDRGEQDERHGQLHERSVRIASPPACGERPAPDYRRGEPPPRRPATAPYSPVGTRLAARTTPAVHQTTSVPGAVRCTRSTTSSNAPKAA